MAIDWIATTRTVLSVNSALAYVGANRKSFTTKVGKAVVIDSAGIHTAAVLAATSKRK
jgi:hypothetical protein